MKTIYYYVLILSLVLISCEKTPVASFSSDTQAPVVGQEVFFNNSSSNAERFSWDFGDGFVSDARNPSHIFNSTGSFVVSLKAVSKSGIEDKATLQIDVLIPTFLEIEVREYYQEYVVPGASIILYPTINDWDAQTNKVSEGFTDINGIAVFSNLDQDDYFVDVWENEHDNYTLRNEDVGFVQTQVVLPNQINRFVAWVDHVNHGKGAGRAQGSITIKKIERVAADKFKPVTALDTTGWRELYSRSFKKK